MDDIIRLCGFDDDKDAEVVDDLCGQFMDIADKCITREDAIRLAEIFYKIIEHPNLEYCMHYLGSLEAQTCHACHNRGEA